jgi:hypothetical protein
MPGEALDNPVRTGTKTGTIIVSRPGKFRGDSTSLLILKGLAM